MNTIAKPVMIDTNPTSVRRSFKANPNSVGFNSTIPLLVSKYFTDVDGIVIDKSLMPAAFQLDFPIYVLGNFDREGGYKLGQLTKPIPAGASYLTTFIYGTQLPFPLFTGFSTIQNYIQPGDLVTVYTDSLSAPNYYCFIVQSFKNPSSAGWGSLLTNLKDSDLICLEFDYYAGSTNNFNAQFNQPISLVKSNSIGQGVKSDINPRAFIDALTVSQNQFVTVKVRFDMNQHLLLTTFMLFAFDTLQFQFKVFVP